jgi:hypothetical protein
MAITLIGGREHDETPAVVTAEVRKIFDCLETRRDAGQAAEVLLLDGVVEPALDDELLLELVDDVLALSEGLLSEPAPLLAVAGALPDDEPRLSVR